MKWLKIGIFAFLIFIILLSSWWVINGDIQFQTDIARDFLLIEDIVKTKKPTLIGPRSGVPGIFHGPIWFYLNLPVFILVKGNPVGVGWFWVFLSILSIASIYYIGKKLFNEKTALFASLLLGVFSISYTNGLFNPFGAVILSPIFFYLFLKYLKTVRVFYLLLSLFTLGMIIQFQIAFGGPILILTIIYLLPFLIKKKKLHHLSALAVLLIPLSTYILFEIRHNFLQLNSIINYVTLKQTAGELGFQQVIAARIKGAFLDGFHMTPLINSYFTLPITALFTWLLFKLKKNNFPYRNNYLLFFYFYFGFWTITLAYKGVVWNYYYLPFLPVMLLVLASTINFINKKLFFVFFLYIFLINLFFGIQAIKTAGSGWKFYQKLAKDIYKDANKQEFGYYVYTPDLFAYSEKYALNYTQQEFPETKSYPYQKKSLTYVIIAPPPKDKPWLDGEWWRNNQVKINSKENKVIKYSNGFIVEKYLLNKEELKIPSDPNLIQDLTFR